MCLFACLFCSGCACLWLLLSLCVSCCVVCFDERRCVFKLCVGDGCPYIVSVGLWTYVVVVYLCMYSACVHVFVLCFFVFDVVSWFRD